eukprot:m.198854 g.198854  ORF g.198854 m.198854 type:complete len:264 (+) comp20570_c0_seq1:98-889(+)
MGCASSKPGKTDTNNDGPKKVRTSVFSQQPDIHVDEKREQDIAERLETAIKPKPFVVGVTSVASKLHKWGLHAKAEVAAQGDGVRHSHSVAVANHRSRENKFLDGLKLLNQRLTTHMLWSEESLDDGNCQFRSVAAQLFGDQERHAEVRAAACNHIASNYDFYSLFDDGGGNFKDSLARMRRDGTWGNELTLRAITDCYGVAVHVVTSNADNWYLTYRPEVPRSKKRVFISYIAPIHYNSIITMTEREMRSRNKHTAYQTKSI